MMMTQAVDPARIALRNALGAELHACLREQRTVAPLRERHPELDIDDAYAISLEFLRLREADTGHRQHRVLTGQR